MNELEQVLEECLLDLERGASNLDECLARHPNHAAHLRPILLTHAYLQGGRAQMPSPAFKARVRARLTRDMQTYPRKGSGFNFAFLRLAASFAGLVFALLVTGTVYAQRALPGDFFYGWKLTSENLWRAVSPDPVGTDLAIAERRVDELLAVGDDPARVSQAQENYLEVVARLRSEMDAENQARILLVLESQLHELNQSGIVLPPSDQDILPPLPESTPLPETLPVPTQVLPQITPTELPQIIPTVQIPTVGIPTGPPPTPQIPTLPIPTLGIPTIRIPPLIP